MPRYSNEETISELVELVGFIPSKWGFRYLQRILSEAWEARDYDWPNYGEYLSKIADEKGYTEQRIATHMEQSIEYIWRYGNPEVIKTIFGYSPNFRNIPAWILFVRTILAIPFYCEDNNLDMMIFLSSIKYPKYKSDERIQNMMAGYILLTLKQLGTPDSEIDKAIHLIDGVIQNNSFEGAYITYVKHNSDMFATVSFDDIIIPPHFYNWRVWDLDYDDRTMRSKVGNALCRAGVFYLKDLRHKSSDDIKKTKMIGEKTYAHFYSSLRKTIAMEDLRISNVK